MRRPQRGEGRASISTWNLGGRGAEKREEREEGGGRRGRGRGAQALPFASVIIVISFEFDYGQKRIRGNRKETCKSLGNDGMGGSVEYNMQDGFTVMLCGGVLPEVASKRPNSLKSKRLPLPADKGAHPEQVKALGAHIEAGVQVAFRECPKTTVQYLETFVYWNSISLRGHFQSHVWGCRVVASFCIVLCGGFALSSTLSSYVSLQPKP